MPAAQSLLSSAVETVVALLLRCLRLAKGSTVIAIDAARTLYTGRTCGNATP